MILQKNMKSIIVIEIDLFMAHRWGSQRREPQKNIFQHLKKVIWNK